ncbi:DUF3179 domain-containing protein [bacterium]|uniref:DUF3179 domain-containing protein n=1 Tax=Candidatus Vogelbacteria bacterium CG10_big_fil_rev_8_21_14_0_10_49_38 TaxID=1975043 RepID=A0A2H0RHH1_9BACT|nr:DUF3179 domain-containing protein [bacterium]PIR45948.1 MAG: hypothetical protein COV08_02310 [Candidatus Vogelbacteria bacterium CG10_big_fil_rev_8_21_14_0_10_49_38]
MKLFIAGLIILGIIGAIWYMQRGQFPVPKGQTLNIDSQGLTLTGQREITVTDGVKHSIPLNEILSGGPGKDGIPSIDDPKFISAKDADFLKDSDPGLGLTVEGENRFYPYRILVWHEIVNDTIQGKLVLVTYCPLCATGIVFERKVDGAEQEFGVSGKLWQSNLLMYNRAQSESEESLWSQVLGEAVLGTHTGKKLSVISSDIIRWSDWRKAHPDTKVLSQDTGALRSYGLDPYEDYYTSESVSFGASFRDERLYPKALVHGVEIDGKYKAYADERLKGGEIGIFAGKNITITRTEIGGVRFEADGEPLTSIPSFWFSWLAVHPETELYK